LGDAIPGEPEKTEEQKALQNAISMRQAIPELDPNFRIPLGKAIVRKPGDDLTVVTWGSASHSCTEALADLEKAGIDVELIDLRTLVPPDMETVLKSVRKTGRLLVVHQDRVFSSIGRELQGAVHDALEGTPVVTHVLGMLPVAGIPQHLGLEHQIVVTPDKVVAAAQAVMQAKTATGIGPAIWIGDSSRARG
jgi:2-oxoisovalerate dehydrogenase E1 component